MNIHKCFKAHKYYSRLDHFLSESMPELSRSQIVKWIKESGVAINGKLTRKKNHEVCDNDVVEMEIPQPDDQDYVPSFQLKKLYEDEYILIIDKPSGVSVHVGAGIKQETILDVFMYHYPQVADMPDIERPGIVHRLDKDTSGVLILAKDIRSMRRLQKQFKKRVVNKAYLALVSGQMRYRFGTIDAPIVRSPRNRTRYMVTDWDSDLAENAREAVTDYAVIREFEKFSYVKLMPHTGRTHQLRVHLSHMGNSVLGDPVYGRADSFQRLALHAYEIAFYHPITDQVIMSSAPFPKIFRDHLQAQYVQKT